MTEYDDTNRGAIFQNKEKKTDKHPDRNGSLNVEGVDYWISGWLQKSKAGMPYMSLSVTRKDAKTPEPISQPVTEDFDDDIPF
jgi:hypothetical protein